MPHPTGNASITSIIEHLKPTLWKLNVDRTFANFAKLSQLKDMPRLKILNCQHLPYRDIMSLRKQMPLVKIGKAGKNHIFNFDVIKHGLLDFGGLQ